MDWKTFLLEVMKVGPPGFFYSKKMEALKKLIKRFLKKIGAIVMLMPYFLMLIAMVP